MPRSSKTAAESSADSLNFETALDQLREIVSHLESGELGLEESLQRFEHGTKLLRTCYSTLEDAEQKIEILTKISDDGTLQTEPFDATSTATKESQKRASQTESSSLPDEIDTQDSDEASDDRTNVSDSDDADTVAADGDRVDSDRAGTAARAKKSTSATKSDTSASEEPPGPALF